MSGKDERPNMDLPICPLCGEEPDFWILYIRGRKWIWLFSKEYLEHYLPTFERITFYGYQFVKLEDFYRLKCGHQASRAINHEFYKDDSEFENVFREVLEQAKYYIDNGKVRNV